MNESTGGQLASEIERAVEVSRGEKVLIIGNKGSGKSTFIERFFEVSLNRETRKKCLFIRIDLAKYSGDNENTLGDWLDRQMKDKIDQALYGNGVPEYDDLQGIFFSDYQKWSQGQHKHLYESDRQAFKIEFGKYLNSVIEGQPHKYCIQQLRNAVSSRNLLPCIVFDNTDQFPVNIQQKVFQFANAVFEEARSAFLIVPITDRTVWQLSKDGPLQSYKSKSFFLPVPSTKKILEKRIQYVGREIETQVSDSGEYALPNGFRIKVENLKAFAACLENVFIENEFIARRIGFLSNFDIRRSLELSRRLMTSHHVGVDNLVSAYLAKNELEIPRWRITTGLVSGPHDNFRQDQSSFILNLFEVDANEINSPLLKLRLLSLLLDKENSVTNTLDSYLTISEIEGYFEPMGVPAQVTRGNLQKLILYRLIEPYDPTEEDIRPGQKVSITTSGKMHRELALYDPVFFSQMALVTGIRSADLAGELKSLTNPGGSFLNRMQKLRQKFLDYCLEQDARFLKIPQGSNNYAGQVALSDELQNRTRLQKAKGRVNWFNRKEGYGFVKLEKLDDDAYLSLTVVEEFGRNSFEANDLLVCDVVDTPKGFHIVSIVEAPESPSSLTQQYQSQQPTNLEMGTVTFYNAEKGFGFIKPNVGGKDILLPRRVLNSAGLAGIDEGQSLLVETEMQIKGPVASSILLD